MKQLLAVFFLILIFQMASASCVKKIGDENGPCVGYITPMPIIPYTPVGISLLDGVAGIIALGLLLIFFRSFFQGKKIRTKKKAFDVDIFFKRFFQGFFGWSSVALAVLFIWATIRLNDGRYVWVSLFLSGMGLIASANGNRWIELKVNHKLHPAVRVILFILLLFFAFTAFLLSIIGSSSAYPAFLY